MPEITFKFDTKIELDEFLNLISTAQLKRSKCKECGCLHTRSSEFCSEKCYNRFYHREVYTPNEQAKPLPKKRCKECGREFYAKNIRAEFCSRRCNQTAYRRNKRFAKKHKLNEIKGKPRDFESTMRHLKALPSIKPIERPEYQRGFQ